MVIFVHGDPPVALASALAPYDVQIRQQGSYEARLARFCPSGWPALRQYPLLHKFLNFAELAALRPRQVLFLDCDTLFFDDVDQLFERYADAQVYAREEPTCGVPVAPSGNRGSYSYYARPGDFLDLHRDVETCDLAMITGLHDNGDRSDLAGALVLYPGRIHEPLSAIRARPNDYAYAVKLLPGQTMIMLGGVVPHRLLPVREGQVRIVSVLCFRAVLG